MSMLTVDSPSRATEKQPPAEASRPVAAATELPASERRRVLVIAPCPFPAAHGTPGSIRELCEATATLGHEVHVATYAIGDDVPVEGVTLHRIRDWTGEKEIVVGPTLRKPFYDLQIVMLAVKLIRRHKIDVVHAHGYEGAIAAAICRFLTGRPTVYSAHNQMGDELASYKFFTFDWLARGVAKLLDNTVPARADVCIPHSDSLRRFLIDRGLEDRTQPVVNFGIDFSDFPRGDRERSRQTLGLGDEPVVMYTGVLDAFQRIDLLLEGMKRVIDYLPDAKLALVTSVPQAEHLAGVRAKAEELGIADRVIFSDPVGYEQACELIAASDVTVVPRPAAVAFPIKLLNYMAARRPAVMYRSSASGVTHDKNIWLVDEDTGEALGDGLLALLNEPARRDRLAESAYEFVLAKHDSRSMARQVHAAYVRALEGTEPTPQAAEAAVLPRPALAEESN